jgi:hypothetical protein
MGRLGRALRHYLHTALTWRAAWKIAKDPKAKVSAPHFQLRKREDGHLYIEPRVAGEQLPGKVIPLRSWPRSRA